MRRERDKGIDRRTLNEKRRKLANADITIRSNTKFLVVLKSNVRGSSNFTIDSYDSLVVDFEDFQSIVKNHKTMFEQFIVHIEDVYCPDDNTITVEDVEEILGLRRIKKDMDETPDDYFFDELLLDTPFEEFREEVEHFKLPLVERLLERAIHLYLEEEFADSYKMSLLEDKTGVKYVFEDARRTKKQFKDDVDIF